MYYKDTFQLTGNARLVFTGYQSTSYGVEKPSVVDYSLKTNLIIMESYFRA